MWGDSLTQSGNPSWPSAMGGVIGKRVYNFSSGGDNSHQYAARAGAIPCLVTVVGGQIPASGSVTATPVPAIPSVLSGPWTGVLAGVPVTMTYLSQGQVTLTRAVPGSAVPCPAGTPIYLDIPRFARTMSQVIYIGAENIDDAGIAATKANVAAMVAACKGPHCLVVGQHNDPTWIAGTDSYNRMIALNNYFATLYGTNYYDIRSWLVTNGLAAAGITPTAQDLIDVANDAIPSSLRDGTVHLTLTGYNIVGAQLGAVIKARGWA